MDSAPQADKQPVLRQLLMNKFSGREFRPEHVESYGRTLCALAGHTVDFQVTLTSESGIQVQTTVGGVPLSDEQSKILDGALAETFRIYLDDENEPMSPVQQRPLPNLQGIEFPEESRAQLTGDLADCVYDMLNLFPGEDVDREGLEDTPKRVAKAYMEDFLRGYQEDPATILKTFNGEAYDEMVLVRDIPFYSLCEHHLVTFFGVAHVGYIPSGRIVGLSKFPRLVDCFARRLQVQERLTKQIANAIQDNLNPQGVMVVVEARHMCMEARGIRKAGSSTTTSAVMGVFKDPARGARQEFLNLIQRKA